MTTTEVPSKDFSQIFHHSSKTSGSGRSTDRYPIGVEKSLTAKADDTYGYATLRSRSFNGRNERGDLTTILLFPEDIKELRAALDELEAYRAAKVTVSDPQEDAE